MASTTVPNAAPGRILAMKYFKCSHMPEKKTVAMFEGTIRDVFERYHPAVGTEATDSTEKFTVVAMNDDVGEVDLDVKIIDIVDAFSMKNISFRCTREAEQPPVQVDPSVPKSPNAFEIFRSDLLCFVTRVRFSEFLSVWCAFVTS